MKELLQTVVFVFRHGKTDHRYSLNGAKDDTRVLSEQGRGEAEKIGRYLRDFAPAAIFSSPRKRCIETAQLIQKSGEIVGQITISEELSEVYSWQEHHHRPAQMAAYLQKIVADSPGQQLVIVSHQWPLEKFLSLLGFHHNEIDAPCLMGQGYRLVFAGDVPVECQKINPAEVGK